MKLRIRVSLAVLGVLIVSTIRAQNYQNVITTTYSRGDINRWVVPDHGWIRYPAYTDRAAWAKVPENIRNEGIRQGERYLGYAWPVIKATDYLEFTRTGNRAVVDSKVHEFSNAYRALLMAELLEGKGRFMDDLINGTFAISERTYWGHSAHFYLYGTNNGALDDPITIVPDLDDPVIDLGVGDIAADLAWGWYFLHEEFDKVSPIISQRLKDEIRRKVLEPYYTRNDFWWMYGWQGKGNVNNWNPWVNYNVLTCILLMEDDPARKADAVYKNLASVDVFINTYPQDGSCSEGPGYWTAAVGRFYNYLDLVHQASNGKIDIFKNEKVREMARYIYRVYISEGVYYTNYSDAAHKINRAPAPIYRIGERIEDPVMKSFAAFLYKLAGDDEKALGGRVGDNLEVLFNPVDWSSVNPAEPLISEFYFPNWDVVIARDKTGTTDGFYYTAKGGSNHEQHNHNDTGSFMLHFNGHPVFLDVGVGTYTRETFGRGRYDIWTMQSNYHNLPVVNGKGQRASGAAEARDSKYVPSEGTIQFSTDIAQAYPAEAGVKSWVRSYTLDRGRKFTVRDRYQLTERNGETSLHFMTLLNGKIVKPGSIRLTGEDFVLDMKYNPDLSEAKIENINIEDPKLEHSLGKQVNRIILTLKKSDLSGEASVEISEASR